MILLGASCTVNKWSLPKDLGLVQPVNVVQGDSVSNFNYIKSQVKVNDQKMYYWYDGNQIGHTKGDYIGKLLDGKIIVRDLKNENVILIGYFKNGLRDGFWSFFDNEGIYKKQIFSNGELDGWTEVLSGEKCVSKSLYRDGEIKKKIIYSDSTTKVTYKNGVPNDTVKVGGFIKRIIGKNNK